MNPRRGLLDFVLTCVTCTAVYTQTPVGALLDRVLMAVLPIERPQRDLTSFFDFEPGEGPTDAELERIVQLRSASPTGIERRAAAAGVPVDLLRALELALDDEREDLVETAALIATGAQKHGHLDAGIEAYLLGDAPVARAIEEASRRGIEEPWRAQNHRRFLTRGQSEKSAPVVNRVMAIHTALTFQWPITESHRITSRFGTRPDPFLGRPRFHNGVDLGVRSGTEVLAAQAGEVERATYDGVNGYYLQLSHGYGLRTAYCHNSQLLLKAGERVSRGQPIAMSGATGRATGPHLHYIVKIGDRAIDPERFREKRTSR